MALEQTPTGEQNLQICEAAGTLAIDLGSTTTVVAFQSAQTAGPQLLELGAMGRSLASPQFDLGQEPTIPAHWWGGRCWMPAWKTAMLLSCCDFKRKIELHPLHHPLRTTSPEAAPTAATDLTRPEGSRFNAWC